MKIKSIEPIAVSLPMKKPVQMAGETVTRADNVLVRIESEDGVVGWGEAASAPTMTGETVASMMAAVDHMTPACSSVRPTISPARRRRWTRGCTATAAPKPRSRSRCTILSAAPPAGRFMRFSAPSSAAACRSWPLSAPRMPPPICAKRRNAGPRAIAPSRSRSASVRPRPMPNARERLHGAQERRRGLPRLRRRQSGFQCRGCARLRTRGWRLRARFLRAAGRRAQSRRHIF